MEDLSPKKWRQVQTDERQRQADHEEPGHRRGRQPSRTHGQGPVWNSASSTVLLDTFPVIVNVRSTT